MKITQRIDTFLNEKEFKKNDNVLVSDPYGSKGSMIDGFVVAVKPGKVQIRLSTHKTKWYKIDDVKMDKNPSSGVER